MFTGRIGVADYWKSVLLLLLVEIVVAVGGGFLFGAFGASLLGQTTPASISGILVGAIGAVLLAFIPALLAGIFALIVGLGLQVRRLHDLGFSGWFVPLLWLLGFVPYLGKTGPGPLDFALWVWPYLAIAGVIGLGITLWPGKPDVNKYGQQMKYRSWWAAAIGDKAPTGPLGKVFWTLLTLTALLAIGAGAFIVLHPIKTSHESTLVSEATTTQAETFNSNSAPQTSGTASQPVVAPTQPTKTPAQTQPKPASQPSPATNITGIGTIPANTFTNNSFLSANTYTTPKGTQTLRPPTDWKVVTTMDQSLVSTKSPHGLTIVQIVDPSGSGAQMALLIHDKTSDYTLASDEAQLEAKGTTVAKSNVSFFGYPGFMLEQTGESQGMTFHMKTVVVAGSSLVFQMTGLSQQSDWSKYDSTFTASFATFQVH